jgi:hypothetical protein
MPRGASTVGPLCTIVPLGKTLFESSAPEAERFLARRAGSTPARAINEA